ncbi:hypothetical protein HJFPF1_02144 [Paramyrothecium foliicola]|nr:hypothetical protein HJFPF1_02144 [Paramyrothecium foliicola]
MANRKIFYILSALLQILSFSSKVLAQDAGLWTQGGLEDATVDDDSYNSGGSISVNGFNIVVPKNLLVQFPAAYVPFKDFVAEKQSLLGYEVNVIGNFVDGLPMAAQITANEFFEGLSSGFIESINFAEGTIKIRAGPTLRISDPNGVFSVGYDGAPFFTADDKSPSVSSYSGFPMCVPRNSSDLLCPSRNRPFQGSGSFTVPDPLSMVPFLPGDFITFSGIRRGNEVICYSIVANNVQILTLNDLVYIRMELALLGIDNTASNNAELAESRFRGFTSNNRATIALYAMDIDPCTGSVTDRIIAAVPVRANAQSRFEFRSDILGGYARDYRAIAEINGQPRTRLTKNGLLAGTYVQPVNEYIHGEQNVPGTAPPANDFSQMPWLTRGVGVDEDGNLWGPLDPFPQTGVIIDPVECGPIARLRYEGDEVDTNWVPSSTLLNQTIPVNMTETANESSETPTVQKRRYRNVNRRVPV